ncbi:MAG TPA: formate dehydrogenase accessory sulfurtransferase FdhD, partial [Candidatus Limnocylindria bacterium]|nr:formate dehydrogenase accessory sulfurtransferase FdhD [Candidatus Limnocylindria bacterium]
MARPQAPRVPIARWRGRAWEHVDDAIAAEEPLQLLLSGEPLSIVMRTPGNDIELALGLLSAEHVVARLADIVEIRISAEAGDREPRLKVNDDVVESNQIDVVLRDGSGRRPERSFLASSACGVCGATTVESLAHDHAPLADGPRVEAATLPPLAQQLRGGQRVFDATGGLHAAALFTADGGLVTLREDIGRHNAVDKVVGRAFIDGRLPLATSILA